MNFSPIDLTYDLCIASALMVAAKIIRLKIKLFQDFFIPTALIAGFLGVILGKYGFNLVHFSSQASSYASILIAVLFATMYLGKQEKVKFSKMIKQVGDTFLINSAAEITQFALALLVGGGLLAWLFPKTSPWFALMMPGGFVGGHGTAAAMGGVFEQAGWAHATTIGQTFATIGLLGGVFGGVIVINYCASKGYTKVIRNASEMPQEIKTGLVPQEKRSSMGDSTISSMSLDPLTWHVALILVAVGAAYLLNKGLGYLFPQVTVPTYGLALLTGVALQMILGRVGLDEYVDRRIISRVGSSLTDYLVAFGVATIDIGVVVEYWAQILVLGLLGFGIVTGYFFLVSRHFFRDHWVERGIYIWGWSTGVMSIAVLLLRIVDPDFETGVLEDCGFAWIFASFIDLALVTTLPLVMLAGYGMLAGVVLLVIAIVFLTISAMQYGVRNNKGKTVFPKAKQE